MAKFDWVDAYNFARVNPGWTSSVLLFAWPLFIALAAVAVVLSPLIFPGAMIASYLLKATNAPAIEKPKPKPAAAAAAAGGASSSGSSYHEQYPEVAPKPNPGEFFASPVLHPPPILSSFSWRRGTFAARHARAPSWLRAPIASPSFSDADLCTHFLFYFIEKWHVFRLG